MRATAVWTLFVLGALLCGANFYFSFLRYPLHLLRGLPKEEYHWVSGVPLLGSLLVCISWLGLHHDPAMTIVTVALLLMDTGGIIWFIGSMIFQSSRSASGPPEPDES